MMNLFPAVYYIIVYLLIFNDASDNQVIDIRGPTPQVESYVIQDHKPLHIVIENVLSVIDCTYNNISGRSRFYSYFIAHNFILSIREVSITISGRWQCQVINMNNTRTNYTFDIRVKGERRIYTKVDGHLQFYKKTNKSVIEYDGVAEHECEEGHVIELACGNLYDSGQIRMRYYDAYGKKMFDVQDYAKTSPLIFRMLIKDENATQSYVDCAYIEPTGQEFIYRTIFTVISNGNISSNDFIVSVNDNELTALSRKVHGRDKYIYYYYDAEPLKLTCSKKNESILGDIHGKITTNSSYSVGIKDIVKTSSVYSALIETKYLDGMIFRCFSKFEQSTVAVDIMFAKEHGDDTFILGLPANNILYQYSTGNNEWITYYQYTDKHVLNLTCITAMSKQPQWISPENITSMVYFNKKYKTKYINNEFNVSGEYNETITCESKGRVTQRMTIVILVAHKTNEVKWTVMGIVTGVLGVFIIGVWMFYFWRRKRNSITVKEDKTSMSMSVIS